MPPRSSPPPAGKPRRRPAPVMPGSWIWLVLLAFLVGVFIYGSFTTTPGVDFSEFLKLINDDKNAAYVKKITFSGTRRIIVELDYGRKPDGDELPRT